MSDPEVINPYVSKARQVTDYERDLLDVLQEEAAEVIQAASKIKRFGVDDVNPRTCIPNRDELSLEVGDLMHIIELAYDARLITADMVAEGIKRKKRKLLKYPLRGTP